MTGPIDIDSASDVARALGPAYERLDEGLRRRHLELLRETGRPADVAVFAEERDGNEWTVTVCAFDHLGLLSLVTGLFAAHRLSIQSGDVFTLEVDAGRPPPSPRGRGGPRRRAAPPAARKVSRRILDVFQIRAPGPLGLGYWETFRGELASLVSLLADGKAEEARTSIIDRVAEIARGAQGLDLRLLPVEVEVDQAASPGHTVLRISASDTMGFIFELSNALAMLNVNIERVEIRTVEGEVRDTFWVTDARGRKIEDERRVEELKVVAALIKQFTHLLPLSPDPVQALQQFRAMTGQIASRPDWLAALRSLELENVLRTLADMMGVSRFLWEDFLRIQHENLFPVLRDTPALEETKTRSELERELDDLLLVAPDEEARVESLNRFKDREMFRTDLRHITGRIGFDAFSEELSDLAEVVLAKACAVGRAKLVERFGEPTLEGGAPCGWSLGALGKFGGRELGFASDIELVLVYEGDGKTEGSEGIANAQFFEELVRHLLRALVSRREGIFEIDLRLRPYGKMSPLACSLDTFRRYFSEGGGASPFERLALTKLRPVAGNEGLGAKILAARDAFVYSGRRLDYDDLLHLRRRQAAELVPPGRVSAKYSPGGLVDVEYFVQARQIEAGRADESVRRANTLEAIRALASRGELPAEWVGTLIETHGFLRRLIEALRVVRGHAKDLTIPVRDSRELAYLARRLQYDSTDRFAEETRSRMEFASALWSLRAA